MDLRRCETMHYLLKGWQIRTKTNKHCNDMSTALQRLWLTEREDTSSANDDHCIIVTNRDGMKVVRMKYGKCLEDHEMDCDMV